MSFFNLSHWGPLRITLVLAAIFSIYLQIDTDLRNRLRNYLAAPERTVLSVAYGPVTPSGNARVVKIKTQNGIQLEIYGPVDNASTPEQLIDTIHIDSKHDSHMQFQGRATNLALKDMNRDNLYEIIAPTYNQDLTPRLNIYTFNIETRKFETYRE